MALPLVRAAGLLTTMFVTTLGPASARALEVVDVRPGLAVIDLSASVEHRESADNRILVSAAPSPDGIIVRMDVRAREDGKRWAVVALGNYGNEPLTRLLAAPRSTAGQRRIIMMVSSSFEHRPERMAGTEDDVYAVTLNPGSVTTYVIELASAELPQLFLLWEPQAFDLVRRK